MVITITGFNPFVKTIIHYLIYFKINYKIKGQANRINLLTCPYIYLNIFIRVVIHQQHQIQQTYQQKRVQKVYTAMFQEQD